MDRFLSFCKTRKRFLQVIIIVTEKIDERTIAKNKGDFNLADKIREELLSKGILIEDQKGKTIWKFK